MEKSKNFTTCVINEVNNIRLNPKSYARKLRQYSSYFDGNVLRIPNKKNGILTTEGPSAFLEAVKYLEQVPKLKALMIDQNLSNAAQEIVDEMALYDDVDKMGLIDRQGIVDKYGEYKGEFGQSVDLGSDDPESVIMNLVVDDGDRQRKNRKMIFGENYFKIGGGSTPHKQFRYCTVLLFANQYVKKGNYKPKVKKEPKYQEYKEEVEDNYDNFDNYVGEIRKDEDNRGKVSRGIREQKKIYASNEGNDELHPGVERIEKSEKIIIDNGVKKKMVKIIKYMEDGEIKTEIFKEKI